MEREILAVVLRSAEDWSRGDLDAYMESYEDSPETTFMGAEIARGRDSVAARYRRVYPTRRQMGKVGFSNLEVRQLAPDLAIVTGKFLLERDTDAGGNGNGIFTLVMRRGPAGWRAIHDHSSSIK